MQACEDDPKFLVDDLNVSLGVELTFKVRVQLQSRCASIIKTTNDANIITMTKMRLTKRRYRYG